MNKKLYSLRTRVILTLSLLVTVVSTTLVYFSARMIYQDKRAYLYENSFQSIKSTLGQLENALTAKARTVRASLPSSSAIENLDLTFWRQDPYLYRIELYNYTDTGPTDASVHYENSSFRKTASKKSNPPDLPYETIENHFKEAREQGIARTIVRAPKSPPRFMVLVHLPEESVFVMFDFIVDKLLEGIFTGISYDVTILNHEGMTFYSNRPYNVSTTQEAFYRNFISAMKDEETAQAGVKELKIDNVDHIMAFTKSDSFSDFYAMGVIKSSEAYEVTSIFILKTTLYALGLVGFFNLIALFLARSVTSPLDALNRTIQRISEGNYNARVEPQKIQELEMVGSSFNVMVDKIEEYNARLEEYNRSLEQKVEERTRELSDANNFIHAMVDSLSQGLLVFDREGTCHSDYTRACLNLFGRAPEGENVADLIKYEDQEVFKSWVNTLFEEPMPFEELLPFGPQSVSISTDWSDPSFKHIALEFFPMRTEEVIENVVMVATDKTREYQAAKENEVQQSYITMLSKILKDKESFFRFASQFNEVLNAQVSQEQIDRMVLMRHVHSFKGMAGFLHISPLVEYLHNLETDLLSESFDMTGIEERITRAQDILGKAVKQVHEFIPETNSLGPGLEVDESKLLEFYEMLKPMDQDYALYFKYHFMNLPAVSYVEQYKSLVQDLAIKLGKKVHPLVIKNGDLRIDKEAYRPFFDSCIHIFRNGLDHGIESPEKRRSLNKDEAGTIELTFDIKDIEGKKFFYFEVKDDGAGIKIEAIKNKLKKLGYSQDQVDQENEMQTLSHVFDPEFSTAETTTDISGRGIGLFDIKEQVEKFEGNIILETQPDLGTKFCFYLKIV